MAPEPNTGLLQSVPDDLDVWLVLNWKLFQPDFDIKLRKWSDKLPTHRTRLGLSAQLTNGYGEMDPRNIAAGIKINLFAKTGLRL